MLPDRVYVEAVENPIGATDWGSTVGGEDPLLGVGVEWDLQPTRVIIEGQSEPHPWDFASLVGLYDGADPSPTPLTVEDYTLRLEVAELTSAVATLSGDMDSIRETSDMLQDILVWLSAGGAATIASLLGVRAIRKSREPQTFTED